MIPECLAGFRGAKNKNVVQNETQSYALGFKDQSESGEKILEIFKEFAAKIECKNNSDQTSRPFFEMIQDFDEIVKVLDMKFVWSEVAQKTDENQIPESTALVYGECG